MPPAIESVIDSGVLAFQVTQLDKKIVEANESLSSKMDQLGVKIDKVMDGHGSIVTSQAVLANTINSLQGKVADTEASTKDLWKEVTSLKVGIAERLGYGAAGGGVTAILIGVVQYFLLHGS